MSDGDALFAAPKRYQQNLILQGGSPVDHARLGAILDKIREATQRGVDDIRDAITLEEFKLVLAAGAEWQRLNQGAPMSTSFAQKIEIAWRKIEIAWRYVPDAIVIITFCGLSALLGIIAAIGYSPKTPSLTLLFVAGGAGILIVSILTMTMTWLETKKSDVQTEIE
jgi:hypothetical protein